MSNIGQPDFTTSDPEPDVHDDDRDPIMRLENVTVEFDMERGVAKALDDVSLDIYQGEILGLVGESGSGKSILASSLLDAVVDPGVITGDITYYASDGRPMDLLDFDDRLLRQFRWDAVSMVFQGAMNSFNPLLTIRSHFKETLDAHDANDGEHFDRAHELLEDLHLDADRVFDAYPHELSGGQKQRALIALSLILEPRVLIMDEPTAALDLLMQRSIIQLLSELQEKYEFTLVFITHDLPLVKNLCDRLAVMYAFEIIELGPTREIIGSSDHPYTRALLNATPNLETPIEDMKPIEGTSPDPVNVPSGCSYHPRCPMADKRCREETPSLEEVEPDHRAACFYWDDVDDTIPIETQDSDGGER